MIAYRWLFKIFETSIDCYAYIDFDDLCREEREKIVHVRPGQDEVAHLES